MQRKQIKPPTKTENSGFVYVVCLGIILGIIFFLTGDLIARLLNPYNAPPKVRGIEIKALFEKLTHHKAKSSNRVKNGMVPPEEKIATITLIKTRPKNIIL